MACREAGYVPLAPDASVYVIPYLTANYMVENARHQSLPTQGNTWKAISTSCARLLLGRERQVRLNLIVYNSINAVKHIKYYFIPLD